MYPLDQFLAPLIGPPEWSSLTTNPGKFSFSLPRPYVTHDPRAGCPDRIRPEFIMSMADPWIGDSAYMLCTNAMSSTHDPMFGNRSLTILPHLPYGSNFHFGPTTRPSLLWPPRPNVLTGIVLPSSG